MYIHVTVGFTALHLLIFVASTPLPDVPGNVQPHLSGDFASSADSSSSTWTPPSVSVGNSIQMKDRDGYQAPPPTNGQNTQRAPDDLFGSVDSSMGQNRPTTSNSEGNESQRQEQKAVLQAPSRGWKKRRQAHDLFGSVDGSVDANRPTLSTDEGNELQHQD